MRTAAANTAGAMTGFMGMRIASQAGGANMQELYQMGQQTNYQIRKTAVASKQKRLPF